MKRKAPPVPPTPRSTAELFDAVDVLIDALAIFRRTLAAALEADPAEVWIDQRKSPLGPRVHCRLARQLKRDGHKGAAITGRRHLLTQSVISHYLRGLPARPPPVQPTSATLNAPRHTATDAIWQIIDDLIARCDAWKRSLGREPTRREWSYWRRKNEPPTLLAGLLDEGDVEAELYLGLYLASRLETGHDSSESVERLRKRGLWRPSKDAGRFGADRSRAAHTGAVHAPFGPTEAAKGELNELNRKRTTTGDAERNEARALIASIDARPSEEAIDAAWRQAEAEVAAWRAWEKSLGRKPTNRDREYQKRRVRGTHVNHLSPDKDWQSSAEMDLQLYAYEIACGGEPSSYYEKELKSAGVWRPHSFSKSGKGAQ